MSELSKMQMYFLRALADKYKSALKAGGAGKAIKETDVVKSLPNGSHTFTYKGRNFVISVDGSEATISAIKN